MSDEVTTNEVEQKVNVTDTQGASDGREGEEKGARRGKNSSARRFAVSVLIKQKSITKMQMVLNALQLNAVRFFHAALQELVLNTSAKLLLQSNVPVQSVCFHSLQNKK